MTVSAIDLFCGVGGLTHGVARSGLNVIAGFDLDSSCRYAYEKNNNSQFIAEDVSSITGEDLLRMYPEGDIRVLLGCAPCQPFSNYTNKNKVREQDDKWKLLYSFARLIEESEPEIISMENVPQIRSQKVFKDFIKRLQELGYHTSWQVVYCPDYGIPQIRKRLVLLASKIGPITLIDPTHSSDNYLTVQDAIGSLEPLAAGETSATDPLHMTSQLSERNMQRMLQSKPGGTWRDWDTDLLAECHVRDSGKTYMSVYGRMEWDKPSPTITTQYYGFGNGRFGHPEQHRALSLREGAILQTFPNNYDFVDPEVNPSFTVIGRQIGNAVPVRLGEVIGDSIMKHLKENGNDN